MGNVRRLIAPIAVTVPLLLLPACSEDEPTPVVEPTSAFQPTGSTGSTAATGSTGTTGETGGIEDLPTTSPGSAAGNISSGQAAFTVTGGIRTSKALTDLVSTVYAPPPGAMALMWMAGGTDATTVGVGEVSFAGTQPTSTTLSLTITVQRKNAITTLISSAGECRSRSGSPAPIRSRERSPCTDLSGGSNAVVDVTGSFNAQG